MTYKEIYPENPGAERPQFVVIEPEALGLEDYKPVQGDKIDVEHYQKFIARHPSFSTFPELLLEAWRLCSRDNLWENDFEVMLDHAANHKPCASFINNMINHNLKFWEGNPPEQMPQYIPRFAILNPEHAV